MKNKFGKIGVLMGGNSSEREISLESGKTVHQALCRAGFYAKAIDINPDTARNRLSEEKLDAAFIALHGKFGEDGTIQKILDDLKIPYTGSGAAASRLAIDKIASRNIFLENKINAPRFYAVSIKNKISDKKLNFPVVVKPAREGSSIGLSIIDNKNGLEEAIQLAFRFDDDVIVEEYIDGKEITVGILGDKPLPVIRIAPKRRFFDFEAKYVDGFTDYIIPADIPKGIEALAQRYAVMAHNALGCKALSRTDMMIGKDGKIYVLELNSIPGLTMHSLLPKAANSIGINFEQLCVKILESSLNNDYTPACRQAGIIKEDYTDYEG